MKTEEIFGNTNSIDFISKRDDVVELLLLCNGFVEGSDENCSALLEKVGYYISYTETADFARLCENRYRVISVFFSDKPDERIIELLYGCRRQAIDSGVLLRVTISGLPLLFDSGC